jgi:hypothetical protein
MGQNKPTFKGGNMSIASALNRLSTSLWRHGVNPAGRPGWSESADGWVPPVVFGGDLASVDNWDIISDPDLEGGSKLRSPFCVWSHDQLNKTVSITNTSFQIGLNKWIVAKASGPIATFLETPMLEIDIVDNWDWYPNAHRFTEGEPYGWIESYIPIWKLVGEDEKTSDMIKVGAENDEPIYGRKYIYGAPRLAMHLSATIAPNRLRLVPEFF